MIKKFELTEEEIDYLDNGCGFNALFDDTPKNLYDDISYGIMLKIREAFSIAEKDKKAIYVLSLTEKEVDYIYELMLEMFVDLEFNSYLEDLDKVLPKYLQEFKKKFQEALEVNNSIFNKLGKPIHNIESLKKRLKEMEEREF